MSGDDLVALLRATERDAAVRPDCPDAGALWAAVSGTAVTEERRAVLDHTVRCPACSESWRIARELAGEMQAAEGRAPAARRRAWYRAAVAAAAVLAVAGGVFVMRERSRAPVYRSAPSAASIRALTEDGADLPRGEFVLRWEPQAEGTLYDVVVTTAGLHAIDRAQGLERAEHRVPPEALAELPAGTRLVWRVTALLPDGRRIRSTAFFAVVAPP